MTVVASMSAIVGLPHFAIVISISSRRMFNTRSTPRCPSTARPQNMGTTNEYRLCSQGESLDDIGSSPDATVEIHLQTPVRRLHRLWKNLDCRLCVVEMPPAVVRNDHPVDSGVRAERNIFTGHDSLGDDRKRCLRLDPRQFVPCRLGASALSSQES